MIIVLLGCRAHLKAVATVEILTKKKFNFHRPQNLYVRSCRFFFLLFEVITASDFTDCRAQNSNCYSWILPVNVCFVAVILSDPRKVYSISLRFRLVADIRKYETDPVLMAFGTDGV